MASSRFTLFRNTLSLIHNVLARDFYKKNENKFSEEDREKAKGLVEESTVRGASQRNADKIWKTTKGVLGAALTEASKIQDVDEMMKPKSGSGQSIKKRRTQSRLVGKMRFMRLKSMLKIILINILEIALILQSGRRLA